MRNLWKNEDGSALLEATAIVPVLILLVGGTLEFSLYFERQHLVTTGVRDAARYLARTDPADPAKQTIAQNIAATGSADGSAPLRVPSFNPANVTIFLDDSILNPLDPATNLRPYLVPAPACAGPDRMRIITVTGSYTFTSPGLLGYFTTGQTIEVRHSERCIGLS